MSNSKQRLIGIAAVIIVALLGINAFLLFNKYGLEEKNAQQEEKISETEDLLKDMEQQYHEAISELDEMKGSNEELNTLIEEQKSELEQQRSKYSNLLRSGKATKADLEDARAQLGNLRSQLDNFVAENNILKEEKKALTQQAVRLTEEKTELQTIVAQERTTNEELQTVRAELVSEKEDLEAEKLELEKKVDIASVVKVQNVEVTGWKIKKSGKATKKKYAKNVDRLRICFDATDNAVVPAGREFFFVRLINPLGETLAVEGLGSGVLTDAKNQDIRYTKRKEFEYNNEAMQSCMNWEPTSVFAPGNYEVEVYNKGHLSGKGTFALK